MVVFVLMLTACAAEQPTITPVASGEVGLSAMEMIDFDSMTAELEVGTQDPDLCALADALPADDLCSLVCDPDALREAMLDAGAVSGKCYLMFCQMSETVHASVGVCLY